MKFGFRTPSLKRRISARTSWKRYVRHSMGNSELKLSEKDQKLPAVLLLQNSQLELHCLYNPSHQ